MGGDNPYIKKPKTDVPTEKFSIEFISQGSEPKKFIIDPEHMPTGGTGLKGSILDIAMGLDIDIDHACGGVSACSTCHVILKEGFESCSEATEDEEDQLDKAPGIKPTSRLSCQCVPNGRKNLVVEIPNWNRNLVREGAH